MGIVVSERVGIVVVMVNLTIVWIGIGIVTETLGCFKIGVVMVPRGI